MDKTMEKIAKTANKVLQEYGKLIGQVRADWESLSADERKILFELVEVVLLNPDISPEALHRCWWELKSDLGWHLGDKYSAARKTSLYLIPYDKLPPEIQLQNRLFIFWVRNITPLVVLERIKDYV